MAEHSSDDTVIPDTQSTIFGDYELLEEIARGGMGVVYKARQQSLDRVVALKLILSGEDAAEEELRRFESEAKSAARLAHPYIVPVYGFGRLEGRPYLAMGFVDGPSLSRRLADHGPLSPHDAASLLLQVAEAVDFAHDKKVIHRDLKPGNVLIDTDGRPRVTDFGLAKRQDTGHSLTATGQVMGTPAYMSPEQAAGEEVGPLSDVYSLGATLYAALTGKPPFDAGSVPEVLLQVSEDPPVPPRQINPAVPPGLEAICLKCLEKRPEDRYSTAAEMAEDLRRFLDSGRVMAGRSRTSRKLGPGIGLAAIVLLAVGAVVWYGRQRDTAIPIAQDASPAVPQAEETPAPAIPANEARLLEAFHAAREAMLPSTSENVWEFRYANGAAAYERAFREFGYTLDQGNLTELPVILKKCSAEFRESVLCGLESWELCAAAAKQTSVLEPLRQAQEALDTVGWRRSLRLLRADADETILLQVLRDALAESPTPEQIELLALVLGTRSPEKNAEVLLALRGLVQHSPNSFLPNLHLASTLMAIGRAKPNEKMTYAIDAVSPLRAAAKALPFSVLPHLQLASVFTELGNTAAATMEREMPYKWQYPDAWPLMIAARKARHDKQYARAIALARDALAKSKDVPGGEIELTVNLILNGQDADAQSVIATLAKGPTEKSVAFKALQDIFQIVESSGPNAIQSSKSPLATARAIERTWNSYAKHRLNFSGDVPQFASSPMAADQAKRIQADWAAYLNLPVELTNSIGMNFVLIPPGVFMMGATSEEQARIQAEAAGTGDGQSLSLIRSEGPQHPVTIAVPFYLSVSEVTQNEYTTVIGANPSGFSPSGVKPQYASLVSGQNTDRHPVENVTAFDAMNFCKKLTELEKRTPYFEGSLDGPFNPNANGYSMTTESQWEYACRAGTNTAWSFGESADVAEEYAWTIKNSAMKTHPVGELKPNAWGLYDMHGNVWEWCIDRYLSNDYERPSQAKSSLGRVTDADRAIRGGSFHREARRQRSAHRDVEAPTVAYPVVGFRVVVPVDVVGHLTP